MLEAEAKLEAHGLLSLVGHGEEVQPALHHLEGLKGQVSTCLQKQYLPGFQSEAETNLSDLRSTLYGL